MAHPESRTRNMQQLHLGGELELELNARVLLTAIARALHARRVTAQLTGGDQWKGDHAMIAAYLLDNAAALLRDADPITLNIAALEALSLELAFNRGA